MGELRLDNFGRAKKNAEFVVDRARSHRRQDPGARRDGGQPAGSGLPQQPGRLGRREHAADREGGQRAAAPDRPRRPARGAAGRSSKPICARCCGMTPDPQPRRRPREAARRGSRRGRRSSPICISPARPRRSSCTATPTTSSASAATTSRATACSRSSWPSSCSAAGRWCCTTTSAAACARSPAATRSGSRRWSRSPTRRSAT